MHRKFTVSCPPCTTFNTPGGRPASQAREARAKPAPGTLSLGLSRKVFPRAVAMGKPHRGSMAGKLKAKMPAHTPMGRRWDTVSMKGPTLGAQAPSCCAGTPHAYSTTSSPRNTSPRASARVFPCSLVMMAAMDSVRSRIKDWSLRFTRERCWGGRRDQVA